MELPSYREIKHIVRNIWPRTIGLFTKIYNNLLRLQMWIAKKMYKKLPKGMKKIVKKMGRIEARMHKIMVCMEPRLRRRYGKFVYPEGLTFKELKKKKKDWIKDFIEFVKNGNAEDEEVEYAEDCFDDVERPKFGYSLKITLKEAEPCEFNLENPELSTCGLNRTNSENSNNSAQSRQTGQEFRSGAPPDCRIEFCGLNTIGTVVCD